MKSLNIAIVVFILALVPCLIFGSTITSIGGDFNATPGALYINWTSSYNGTMTMEMNDQMVLTVRNSTNTVRANYSQPGTGWSYGVAGYSLEECGISGGEYFYFYVDNGTLRTTNTRNVTSQSMVLDSKRNGVCPPGRYWGRIDVTNASLSNYAKIEVIMDLPITSSNSLDQDSGVGQFRGTTSTSDKTYHYYYFNTSEIQNATTLTISNMAVDAFLFGQSVFRSKNIMGSSEDLIYQYLPQDQLWQVRVFDNSSSKSYSGLLKFSTLSVVRSSSPSNRLSVMEFGEHSPSYENNTGLRLKNEGNLTLSSVSESSEVYHTETYTGIQSRNFTTRVPAFTDRLTMFLDWNGGFNYTMKLYKPDGTLVGTSDGEYFNANVSGAIQEEYVDYDPTGTVGSSDDGMWKIEVINNTPFASSYNLTSMLWFYTTNWVSTNYSSTTFNLTGDYKDFDFNFTVQNTTLSGQHNGSLKYESSSGAIVSLPFSFNVTVPELMVNKSFSSSTIFMNENTGSNRTLVLNLSVNNTGNQVLDLSNSSSSALYHSTPSNYMNFSYVAPTSISADSYDSLDVTINIDINKTNNQVGTYTGWIYLNDSDARPYSGFNLTLQVILSNTLTVNINNISTKDGDMTVSDTSSTENITLETEVYYANGSLIEDDLGLSNFGSVYLKNKNVTGYTVDVSESSLVETSGPGTLWHGGGVNEYWLNFTLGGSSTRPGGYYDVYLSANKSATGVTLGGTGSNGTLILPGPGIYFGSETSLDDFEEANEDQYYNLTVTNYGTVAVDVDNITLNIEGDDEEECEDLLDIEKHETCTSDDISPGETCVIYWTIDSDETDYIYDCTLDIEEDISGNFNSPGSESFSIDIDSGSDDSSDSSSSSNDDEESIEIYQYPSTLSIVQGESQKFDIDVENDGDTDESGLELEVTGINSGWVSSTPNDLDLDSGNDDDFKVNITVPSDALVKSYSLTFKVSNDDVSDSKTSTLNVLPSEDKKLEINNTYDTCLENYTQLEEMMNEMVRQGKNVTELNETLVQIKSKLDTMCDYIENDDYFNAAQIEIQLDSLLNVARVLATQDESSPFGIMEESSSYVWLFIGVIIIIIAGFLIYMFMPPPEDSYKIKKFNYRSPDSGSSMGSKIRKQLEKIKLKIKDIRPQKEKDKGYSWKKK